jgi:hypothetical protein
LSERQGVLDPATGAAGMYFDAITNISIAAHASVLFEPFSVNVANNYAGMFKINHIQND